jgi:hypothetical protein
MKRKRRSNKNDMPFEQIGLMDIKLHIGDKLYKNGKLYAVVKDESEELYFLKKEGSRSDIPTPYFKDTIIENILFGTLIIERLNFI